MVPVCSVQVELSAGLPGVPLLMLWEAMTSETGEPQQMDPFVRIGPTVPIKTPHGA